MAQPAKQDIGTLKFKLSAEEKRKKNTNNPLVDASVLTFAARLLLFAITIKQIAFVVAEMIRVRLDVHV